jgi:hypothetical protein
MAPAGRRYYMGRGGILVVEDGKRAYKLGDSSSTRLCRYGRECTLKVCMFRHPNGRAIDEPKSSRLCAYGAECRAPSCEFRHPGGRNAGALPPCRYGSDCKRPGCSFEHPSKESAGSSLQAHFSEAGKESKGENRSSGEGALQEQKGGTHLQPCMWGRACHKAGCKFFHAEGRGMDGQLPPADGEALHLKMKLQARNYWRSFPGSTGDQHVELVDVTAEMLDAVQVLMDATCVGEFLGRGRSAYSSMRVVSISRVENHTLWRRYAMQCRGHLRPADSKSAVQVDTWQHLPEELEESLDRGLNECFLFHGTKPELAAVICAQGFEERVANDHGLFGAGVYFAENSSKSDGYVKPDEKGYCNMFLTRVCLGAPFISNNQLSGLRRPPCVEACESGRACGHVRFDSVIGEKRGNDRRACLEKYREYIVYDRNQCYPEFLIRYVRESAGERSAREKREGKHGSRSS